MQLLIGHGQVPTIMPEASGRNAIFQASQRSHSNNLYSNWLNYYVYQMTPYELKKGGRIQ